VVADQDILFVVLVFVIHFGENLVAAKVVVPRGGRLETGSKFDGPITNDSTWYYAVVAIGRLHVGFRSRCVGLRLLVDTMSFSLR
jgi:hypothetical protein